MLCYRGHNAPSRVSQGKEVLVSDQVWFHRWMIVQGSLHCLDWHHRGPTLETDLGSGFTAKLLVAGLCPWHLAGCSPNEQQCCRLTTRRRGQKRMVLCDLGDGLHGGGTSVLVMIGP